MPPSALLISSDVTEKEENIRDGRGSKINVVKLKMVLSDEPDA